MKQKIITVCLICLTLLAFQTSFSQKKNFERNYKYTLKKLKRFKIKKYEVRDFTILSNYKLLIAGWKISEFDINNGEIRDILPEKNWFNNGLGYISSITNDKNNYYIVDNKEKKLMKYSINDKEKYTIKPFERLDQGIHIGNENYILTHYQQYGDSWHYQFTLYNAIDKKIKNTFKFKNLIKDKNYNEECADFQFSGFFSSSSNYTYYISERSSYFFAFNNKGELLYSNNTIFNTPVPKSVKKSFLGGRSCELIPNKYANRSITNTNHYLYVLSNHGNEENQKKFCVDMYTTKDGNYYGSVVVPYLFNKLEPYPQSIKIEDSKLFVIYDENVVVYEILTN